MMFNSRKFVGMVALAAIGLSSSGHARPTPVGTAFTFQGQLKQGGNALTNTADLKFTLFDSAGGPVQVGPTVTLSDIDITEGLFTVDLNFGASIFDGNERWLKIEVRVPHDPTNLLPFTALTPRQPVMPVPYALHALSANGAAITNINAANITSGTIDAARMPTGGNWALSSPLNLDSNSLVLDPINNRVGIGTATPNVPLEVAGVARFTGIGGFSLGSDPGRNRVSASGPGNQKFAFVDTSDSYTGIRCKQASIGGSFGDLNSPAEGLIVQGNVGVGTATPLLPLDVFGSSGPAATTGNAANGIFRVRPSSTSAILDMGGTGSPAHAWLQSRDSANYASNFNLALNPNGGNVGIGTTTPLVKLDIEGLNVAAATSGTAANGIARFGPIGSTATLDVGFQSSPAHAWLQSRDSANYATNFSLALNPNGGTVGIGTATPDVSYSMTVRGSATGFPLAGTVYRAGSGAVSFSFPGPTDTANFDIWNSNDGFFRFGTFGQERMRITNIGRVGIGTAAPSNLLHVDGAGVAAGGISGFDEVVGRFRTSTSSTHTAVSIDALTGHDPILYFAENGTAIWDIRNDFSDGLPTMEFRSHTNQGPAGLLGMQLRDQLDGTGCRLRVFGRTVTDVLEITGADLAEEFPMSEKIEPGMVVAIDAENPGELCLSRGAYNKRVAGIVAGANNFSTGVVLGRESGNINGAPVALSGRVYVWCDATERAIEPGDMLTTAERAGYAMAVSDHSVAVGSVIGKAMTALNEGETGLVLVLVNLQ